VSWEESPGAKGLREERERLFADLDQARAEVERLRAELERMRVNRDWWEDAEKAAAIEADRLRAVLAETPENVAAVIASIEHPERGLRDVVWDGARILAALRARAGVTP
jgi:predicted nuclease with TOPRIM domain